MRVDVKDQLRQFGEWHDERQDKVGAADVVERVRPVDLVHRTPRIRRRSGIVVAVAAFVVALVIGVPLLLSLGGDETAPADQPTPSTQALVDETVMPDEPIDGRPTVPAPEVVAAPWYRVVDAEGIFDGAALNDIVEFDGQLVAVGHVDGTAAIFTSEDGVTWSRITIVESSGGNPDLGSLSVVAEGGLGLVALGPKGLGGFEVWTSADGVTWSEVPQSEQSDQAADVADIVAGGPGLLAVGSVGVPAPGGVDDGVPVMWTSSDGFQWERVPHEPSVFSDSGGMFSVAAGNGVLLAIGEVQGSAVGEASMEGEIGGGHVAVLFKSEDGINWSRERVVTLGYDIDFFNGIFVTAFGWSTDGTTWTPYSLGVDGDSFHPATLFEVVGDRLIAEQRPGMGFPWTAHASTDGKTWTDEGIVVPGFDAVAAGGPGMVAVGERNVAVWFDHPADADAYGDLIALDVAPLPREDDVTAQQWLPFRVAAVDAMLAVYNEGRYDEWLAAFGGDPAVGNGLGIEAEAALMAANGRWRRTGECSAWPGYIVCGTTRSDDFYGAGGFDHDARFLFLFANHTADLIGYEVAEDLGPMSDWFDEHGVFDLAFLDWLGTAHPEVAIARGTDLFGIAATDMATALEYVEEFVAQSEKYPIDFPADR